LGNSAATFIEPSLDAKGLRIAIAAGRFNSSVSELLVGGAIQAIVTNGGSEADICVAWVPGSFEIPLVCNELAKSGQYDAVVAVGTLIEGETDHYRLIADSLSRGLAEIGLQTGVPVTFGVITAKSLELALKRSGTGYENRGYEAALAAIETANVLTKIRKR